MTLCNLSPASLLCSWNFLGKNTGVGFHFLFQGIFLTQGSNSHFFHLLNWQVVSLPPHHLGCSNRYILLYIKQVANTDLLCSTGNYIQYSCNNLKWKRIWKRIYLHVHIYICNWITLLYTRNIVNQLYFNFFFFKYKI